MIRKPSPSGWLGCARQPANHSGIWPEKRASRKLISRYGLDEHLARRDVLQDVVSTLHGPAHDILPCHGDEGVTARATLYALKVLGIYGHRVSYLY